MLQKYRCTCRLCNLLLRLDIEEEDRGEGRPILALLVLLVVLILRCVCENEQFLAISGLYDSGQWILVRFHSVAMATFHDKIIQYSVRVDVVRLRFSLLSIVFLQCSPSFILSLLRLA